MPLPPSLSGALATKIEKYLRDYGPDALERALDSGHLFSDDLRDGSKLALQHSAEYVDAGVPCALVIVMHPRHKKVGERVTIALHTGEAKQLTLELPSEEDRPPTRLTSVEG